MEARFSAQEVRERLSDILGMVYYAKQSVIVERRGRRMAVVITPEDYELLQRVKREAMAAVAQLQERNADRDSNQVLADVTEVVEQVRRERYER